MSERLEELQGAIAAIKEAAEKYSIVFADSVRDEFLSFLDDSINDTLAYEVKELEEEIEQRGGAEYEASRLIDYNNATRG